MSGRLLKLADAAAYCGLPARNFRRHVRVPPVRLGPHELWDRQKLDAYIEALQGGAGKPGGVDWSDAIQKL